MVGTTRKDAASAKAMDEETKALLYEGASISQLGQLFQMDNRSVAARLGNNVEPAGKRVGHPIYLIRDAAKYLVEHDLDFDNVEKIAAYMQKADPNRFPRAITKEFWAAMLQRQKYLEQAGELWPTEKVVEVIGDLLKLIQMPLRLARDTVSNEQELTPRQQQILLRIVDGISEELYTAVVERFGDEIFRQEEENDEEDDDSL